MLYCFVIADFVITFAKDVIPFIVQDKVRTINISSVSGHSYLNISYNIENPKIKEGNAHRMTGTYRI